MRTDSQHFFRSAFSKDHYIPQVVSQGKKLKTFVYMYFYHYKTEFINKKNMMRVRVLHLKDITDMAVRLTVMKLCVQTFK